MVNNQDMNKEPESTQNPVRVNVVEKPIETEQKSNPLMNELSEIRLQILEIRKDIQSAVTPKFLDISIPLKDLIELAVEMWRLEGRMSKLMPLAPETQRDGLTNSIQKLKRYLSKSDIEIIDYTNQKFNEGRNLDILAVEKEPNAPESIIRETKEPTILYKGQVVRKGKVIILVNNSYSEAQNE